MSSSQKRPPKPVAPIKLKDVGKHREEVEVSLSPILTHNSSSRQSTNPFELAAVNPFNDNTDEDNSNGLVGNPFFAAEDQQSYPPNKQVKSVSILDAIKTSAIKNKARLVQINNKKGYNPFDQQDQEMYTSHAVIENANPPAPAPSSSSSSSNSKANAKTKESDRVRKNLEREKLKSDESRHNFRKSLLRIERSVDTYSDQAVHGVSEDKDNAVIRFLLSSRVYGYPGSTGSLLSNYKYFVYNNHPFFSICCLHSKHVYNRRQRTVVFFNTLCFAIFISFILLGTTLIRDVAICRFPCDTDSMSSNSTVSSHTLTMSNTDVSILASNTANAELTCHGGYNDGLTYDKYHSHCQYYHPIWLSFVSGLILTVFSSFLQFLATCSCLQGHRSFQNNCVGRCLKNMVESCGGAVLAFCTTISIVLLIYSIIGAVVLKGDNSIVVNTLLSKAWSALEWFGYSLPYFCLRYPGDKKKFYEDLRQKNNSTGSASVRREEVLESQV